MKRLVVALVTALLSTPSGAQISLPQWEIAERADPFSDVTTTTMLQSSEDFAVALAFSCEEGMPIKLSAIWLDVRRNDTQEAIPMDWRIGDLPPTVVEMSNVVTRGDRGFSVSNTADAIKLAEELAANGTPGIKVNFRADGKLGSVLLDGFERQWRLFKQKCQ